MSVAVLFVLLCSKYLGQVFGSKIMYRLLSSPAAHVSVQHRAYLGATWKKRWEGGGPFGITSLAVS